MPPPLSSDRDDPVEREQAAERSQDADAREARLIQLAGLGPISARVLVDEVFHRDFANRREVAGYVGLTPSPWRSGGLQRDRGVSRAGNPRARRTAVELAWLWLRHQPDSQLSRWFCARVGATRGRFKRIMIVALARKLVVALWRYLATGAPPESARIATA